jgi:hypothetical protein
MKADDDEYQSTEERPPQIIIVTKIKRAEAQTCGWALTDRDGFGYPHGVLALRRVEGAGEWWDGIFCVPHAKEAVQRAREEKEADERDY